MDRDSGEKRRKQPASLPERPILRSLDLFPMESDGRRLHVLRDPEGIGRMVALPHAAAVIALLMDGRRTLDAICAAFRESTGHNVERRDVEAIVAQLDAAHLLAGQRFERYRRRMHAAWLKEPVRPAAHAGASYADEAEELHRELDELLWAAGGPPREDDHRAATAPLRGLLSPHIDPGRGGVAYGWAYDAVRRAAPAETFVILGTCHAPMAQRIALTRKDFATPLGIAPVDREYLDRLTAELGDSVVGRWIDPWADEIVHRNEHTIEFQVLMLQHVLGPRRPLRIVPILVGSLGDFIEREEPPTAAPEIEALVAALRAAEQACPGGVCYISASDLAHIGQRYGDEELLSSEALAEQQADDAALLQAAARGDAEGFFAHVAAQGDRRRICGLAPTYLLLRVLEPVQGRLLHYGQAVEPGGTACVSFASMALA